VVEKATYNSADNCVDFRVFWCPVLAGTMEKYHFFLASGPAGYRHLAARQRTVGGLRRRRWDRGQCHGQSAGGRHGRRSPWATWCSWAARTLCSAPTAIGATGTPTDVGFNASARGESDHLHQPFTRLAPAPESFGSTPGAARQRSRRAPAATTQITVDLHKTKIWTRLVRKRRIAYLSSFLAGIVKDGDDSKLQISREGPGR